MSMTLKKKKWFTESFYRKFQNPTVVIPAMDPTEMNK